MQISMTGITVLSLVLSLMALSASFVAAIILTILFTRETELPETETDSSGV